MIEISLSESEAQVAAEVGAKRHIFSIYRNKKPNNGAAQSFNLHIDGALSEMAVAKALKIYFTVEHEFSGIKDFETFEVRSTTYLNGCLYCLKKDLEDRRYVLVINQFPIFKLVGWSYGKEIKQEKYWKDKSGVGRWAYWMPQSDLRTIETFNIIEKNEQYIRSIQ